MTLPNPAAPVSNYECPLCGFDDDMIPGDHWCPMCAEERGLDVFMRCNGFRDTDEENAAVGGDGLCQT